MASTIKVNYAQTWPDKDGRYISFDVNELADKEMSVIIGWNDAIDELNQIFNKKKLNFKNIYVFIKNDFEKANLTEFKEFCYKNILKLNESPYAWTPLTDEINAPRHARIPAFSYLWQEQEKEWNKIFCFSNNFLAEINSNDANHCAKCFCVLHEIAHCIHANAVNFNILNNKWLYDYLGADLVDTEGFSLINKLITSKSKNILSEPARLAFYNFFGQVQEGFADCFATIILSGKKLQESSKIISLLRSGSDLNETHQTHYALNRLHIKTQGDNCNNLKLEEIYELALSCSIEGALEWLYDRAFLKDKNVISLLNESAVNGSFLLEAVNNNSWHKIKMTK